MATLNETQRFVDDYADPLEATLTVNGAAQPLAGATVVSRMKRSGGEAYELPMTVVSAAAGTITRDFDEATHAELGTVGDIAVEFEVTFADGTQKVWPGPNEDAAVITVVARRT